MRGLAILILIVVFFWFVWPMISRWLKRKAMERAENYVRASMGMPPRDRKKERQSRQQQRRSSYGYRSSSSGPIIPKEYAEDVEFTETKDFSDTRINVKKGKVETYHESQISDAEWTEIKKPRSK